MAPPRGLIEAITSLYDDEGAARHLLARLGFPAAAFPAWDNPAAFWHMAFRELEKGRVEPGWPDQLLAEALLDYPGNPALLALPPPRRGSPGSRSGSAGPKPARPEPIRPEPIRSEPTRPPSAADLLPDDALLTMHAHVQAELDRRVPTPVYAMGPDGSCRRLQGLRRATTARDLVQAWFAHLGPAWPRDADGTPAQVFCVLTPATGAPGLIAPDRPLLKEGLVAGDTLRLIVVNPRIDGELSLAGVH